MRQFAQVLDTTQQRHWPLRLTPNCEWFVILSAFHGQNLTSNRLLGDQLLKYVTKTHIQSVHRYSQVIQEAAKLMRCAKADTMTCQHVALAIRSFGDSVSAWVWLHPCVCVCGYLGVWMSGRMIACPYL